MQDSFARDPMSIPIRLVRCASLLVLAVLLAPLGCNSATSADGWSLTRDETTLDGAVLRAAKEFRRDDSPTFLEVAVTCIPADQQLEVRVGSYETAEVNGVHPGSLLRALGTGEFAIPIGRLRMGTGAERFEGEANAAFHIAEYGNMATWKPVFMSAQQWQRSDSAAFWQWAETVTKNDYTANRMGVGFLVQGAILEAVGTGEIAPLAPGAYLATLLPVTVELSNTGGRHEVTIPADNPVVAQVLDACGGTGWWTRAPESGVATAARDTAQATSAAAGDTVAPAAAVVLAGDTTGNEGAGAATSVRGMISGLAVVQMPDTVALSIPGGASVPGAGPGADRGASGGINERIYQEFQLEHPVRRDPSSPSVPYPAALRGAGLDGEVVAQFVVDTSGRVRPGTFKVLKSSHDAFTAAVRAGLPTLVYIPATRNGAGVAQVVQESFTFTAP